MKRIIVASIFWAASLMASAQTLPVYLDMNKPVAQRIDDALSRMTLAEKIAVLHAQSKFSAAGVKRLGFPDFWTDDGPHGVRPEVLFKGERHEQNRCDLSCPAHIIYNVLRHPPGSPLRKHRNQFLSSENLFRPHRERRRIL